MMNDYIVMYYACLVSLVTIILLLLSVRLDDGKVGITITKSERVKAMKDAFFSQANQSDDRQIVDRLYSSRELDNSNATQLFI